MIEVLKTAEKLKEKIKEFEEAMGETVVSFTLNRYTVDSFHIGDVAFSKLWDRGYLNRIEAEWNSGHVHIHAYTEAPWGEIQLTALAKRPNPLLDRIIATAGSLEVFFNTLNEKEGVYTWVNKNPFKWEWIENER